MIRQLSKTNLIGGQLEWRFILGYSGGKLVIKDMHIAPISRNIIYNNFTTENTLNFPHRDNIRKLYNKIAGDFFAKKTNPILKTDYPIHVDDASKSPLTTTMEQQYEMGARRENVKLYGKQFSFFCPFWMDEIGDFESGLKFIFCITNPSLDDGTPSYMCSDTTNLLDANNDGLKMVLAIDEENNADVYRYIMEYINSINLNSDLLNINLQENTASLCGVECTSGDLITKSVNNIIVDLEHRERPMLEQMNMITKLFSDNNIICRQIFNFRFYFDLDDIVIDLGARKNLTNTPLIYSVFMSNSSNFNVRESCSNIDLYDFHTNFEFLNKKRIDTKVLDEFKYKEQTSEIDEEYNTNALKYLRDNECIDLIHENKLNQQTCYWRLYDNEDQIFNFYKGLNYDVYTDGKLVGNNDGMFDKSPMMSVTSTEPGLFSYNWVNTYICDSRQYEANKFASRLYNSGGLDHNIWMANYVKPYFSKFTLKKNTQVFWNNLIKYDISNNITDWRRLFDDADDDEVNLYIVNLKWDTDAESKCVSPDGTNDYVIVNVGHPDDESRLTLKYFSEHPDEFHFDGDESTINGLIDILAKSVVRPSKIMITKSLQCKTVDGPSKDVTEFRYVYDNNACVQLYRYGGNLYPMFIPALKTTGYRNFQYAVKQYDDYYSLDKPFIDFLGTKYKSIYPSIGYDSVIRVFDVINYYKYFATTAGGAFHDDYGTVPEYQWYQASMLRKLNTKVTITVEDDEINDDDLLVKEFIEASGFGDADDENLMKFVSQHIIVLYDRKIKLESVPVVGDDVTIKNIYSIEYNLK